MNNQYLGPKGRILIVGKTMAATIKQTDRCMVLYLIRMCRENRETSGCIPRNYNLACLARSGFWAFGCYKQRLPH